VQFAFLCAILCALSFTKDRQTAAATFMHKDQLPRRQQQLQGYNSSLAWVL